MMQFNLEKQDLEAFITYSRIFPQYGKTVTVSANKKYLTFQGLHESRVTFIMHTFENTDEKEAGEFEFVFEVRSELLRDYVDILRNVTERFKVASGEMIVRDGWFEIHAYTTRTSTSFSFQLDDEETQQRLQAHPMSEPYVEWEVGADWMRKLLYTLPPQCEQVEFALNPKKTLQIRGRTGKGQPLCVYKLSAHVTGPPRTTVSIGLPYLLKFLEAVPEEGGLTIRFREDRPCEIHFCKMVCYIAPCVDEEEEDECY
jgi:hypothetical protein